jgi:hypothetical protein
MLRFEADAVTFLNQELEDGIDSGNVVVKALRYEPEGYGFETR